MHGLILVTHISQVLYSGDAGKLDKNGVAQLGSLRDEVERIRKAKEEYVKEHPEHAKLVFPSGASRERKAQTSEPRPQASTRSLFGPDGLPLHPERSIYYDPIMNPYGVAPPGMPYVERRKQYLYLHSIRRYLDITCPLSPLAT